MLTNKVAIITGASRGLGLAISQHFIKQQAKIVMVARESDEFYEVVSQLKFGTEHTEHVVGYNADITKPDEVGNLVKFAIKQFGQIDILVCNAGIYGPIGLTEEVNWLDWIETVEVNLFGTVLCCRAVTPHMRHQGHGKIITLSGGGATKPMPRFSAYAASKAAVVRFTETLAKELDDCGIDVNAVAPGTLNTRFVDYVLEMGPHLAGEEVYQHNLEIKNDVGTPMRYPVSLIEFLASSKSDGVTGRLISAIWDRWYDPKFIEQLDDRDAYTLRRTTRGSR